VLQEHSFWSVPVSLWSVLVQHRIGCCFPEWCSILLEQKQNVPGVVFFQKKHILIFVRKAADLFKKRKLVKTNFREGVYMILKKHLSTKILGTLLLSLSVCSLFVGATDIDLKALLSGGEGTELKIFLLARVPRLLAILCTGIGMSVAGLIMQQLCRNKFVSPSTGATIQSAQFGVLLSLVCIPSVGLWGRVLLAFAMSVLGTWIFVWFVQKIQFKDTVMVPLVGIMFGNILGGITSFIAYRCEVTQQLSTYFVGSFALIVKGNYELVWIVVPLVVLAFVFAKYFNIVGMGRDFSRNLGVHYNVVLFMGLTIAAMISAGIVTVVGQISYIGLIVPNVVAMFKGDNIKGTLVDTALLGALFVLVCDMAARSVIMPYELPIELIVGIAGSLLFIAMLICKLNHGRKAIRLWKAKEDTCYGSCYT